MSDSSELGKPVIPLYYFWLKHTMPTTESMRNSSFLDRQMIQELKAMTHSESDNVFWQNNEGCEKILKQLDVAGCLCCVLRLYLQLQPNFLGGFVTLQLDALFSLCFSWSTTLVQTEIPQQLLDRFTWLILYRHSPGPQRMNPNDFNDPLTFLLAPPLDWQ